MRLPGCINWPNQRKQAMGLGPALAKIISWDDKLAYDLEIFPVLAGSRAHAADLDFDIETPDLTALPPRLMEIIEHGRVEGEQLDGDDSGSGWAFHLALHLLRLGWPVGRVAGALLGLGMACREGGRHGCRAAGTQNGGAGEGADCGLE